MKSKKTTIISIFTKIFLLISFVCATVGSGIYIYINQEIFNNLFLMILFFAVFLLIMGTGVIYSFCTKKENTKEVKIANLIVSILTLLSGLFVVVFELILDLFQPLAIFTPTIICFVLFLLTYGISSILNLFSKTSTKAFALIGIAFIGIISLNTIWANTQEYSKFNENIPSKVVFQKDEGDYATYRIPTLLLMDNKGNNQNDALVVFTEARHSSVDKSESELVTKTSMDGGKTFNKMEVAISPTDIFGKVGRIADPTAVYDKNRNKICLIFIAGTKESNFKLSPYYMEGELQNNGSIIWDKENIIDMAQKLGFEFSAGPSKGTFLSDGRIAFPIRSNGQNYVLYTKDGINFQLGDSAGVGGEVDMDSLSDNELVMITRSGNMSAFPRNNHLNFAYSSSNGKTWDRQNSPVNLRTPSVMSSISAYNNNIYVAYADSFLTRANLSYAVSNDKGKSFKTIPLYEGASGYTVSDISQNGKYYIIAEIGKVEYHEEIRLFTVDLKNE